MDKKIQIIFIGSDAISAPLLDALANDDRFEVKLVISQIDKAYGRNMKMQFSAVKKLANQLKLKVYQSKNINSKESLSAIESANADMIVLMAFGQILGKKVLESTKFGAINIHASILPKYRGASPIQESLLQMDSETGISIMRMVKKMDAGPVFTNFKININNDNRENLTAKLAQLTAHYTGDVLYDIARNDLKAEEQNDEDVSYCKKINKEDGEINWNENSKIISAKIKAYSNWPSSFTFWKNKRIKILKARADKYNLEKEGVIFEKDHIIMVGAKNSSLIIEEVQIEGKKAQNINQFIQGYQDFIGSKLGL